MGFWKNLVKKPVTWTIKGKVVLIYTGGGEGGANLYFTPVIFFGCFAGIWGPCFVSCVTSAQWAPRPPVFSP